MVFSETSKLHATYSLLLHAIICLCVRTPCERWRGTGEDDAGDSIVLPECVRVASSCDLCSCMRCRLVFMCTWCHCAMCIHARGVVLCSCARGVIVPCVRGVVVPCATCMRVMESLPAWV